MFSIIDSILKYFIENVILRNKSNKPILHT